VTGPEEGCGDDGDAIGAAVGVSAGGDDHCVAEVVAEVPTKPAEVPDVGVVNGG